MSGSLARALTLRADATGTGDVFTDGTIIKYIRPLATGGDIEVKVTVNAGAGTWTVESLRVYGIT
jgi:hypothetical protein